jgi:hypothetical protein
MKTLLILVMTIVYSNSTVAQSCKSIIGESEFDTMYNESSKTCKLRLTDGRCIRVQATPQCPGSSVQPLNEAQSAVALKEYEAKQKAIIDGYQNLREELNLIDECNRFKQESYSCAGAANYEQCMTIRYGNSYRAMPQKCNQ